MDNHPDKPDFFIGSVPIVGKLILAPMDGISDPTFRWITRQLGSAYSVSEFINTLDYSNQKKYQKKRLYFREAERPFAAQLLDNDAGRMSESAARIEAEFHPDFIDINMGCSVKTVTSRGAGSALMNNPKLAKEIVERVSQTIKIPFTVKMRLGWDEDHINYREISEMAVEFGASAVALHGRTAKMSYVRPARWQPIAELKKLLPVPVIGNGDVSTPSDAHRMLQETGCDAVMIGRAAKANPWIFSYRDRSEITPKEVHQLAHYQLKDMLEQNPEGFIMPFRKYLKAYLEPYQISKNILHQLLTCTESDILFELIDQVFESIYLKQQ